MCKYQPLEWVCSVEMGADLTSLSPALKCLQENFYFSFPLLSHKQYSVHCNTWFDYRTALSLCKINWRIRQQLLSYSVIINLVDSKFIFNLTAAYSRKKNFLCYTVKFKLIFNVILNSNNSKCS